MKPDWKDAPDWAEWLYLNAMGVWVFCSEPPVFSTNLGRWVGRGTEIFMMSMSGPLFDEFKDLESSMERRPQTTKPAEAGSEGQGA